MVPTAAVALLAAVWGGTFVERSVLAQVPAAAQNAVAANQQFARAAALHNRQAWDLAADEWAKFIKDFAADERVSLARHYLGVCRLQLKDYAGAAAVLQELITANPKFEQIASSKLYLGMAQFNAGQQGKAEQFAAAEKTLAAALEDHPEGKQVPQTVYYLAESLYAQDKKKEAEPLYARFVADFSEDALAPDALYAHGVVLEELGKSEKAREAYAGLCESVIRRTGYGSRSTCVGPICWQPPAMRPGPNRCLPPPHSRPITLMPIMPSFAKPAAGTTRSNSPAPRSCTKRC